MKKVCTLLWHRFADPHAAIATLRIAATLEMTEAALLYSCFLLEAGFGGHALILSSYNSLLKKYLEKSDYSASKGGRPGRLADTMPK